MQVTVAFTQDELKLISRGLVFGVIHTDGPEEERKMKELGLRISALASLQDNNQS